MVTYGNMLLHGNTILWTLSILQFVENHTIEMLYAQSTP